MNNKQIDKLGEQLVIQDNQSNNEALMQLQEFRKSFQEPLAEVFAFVLQNARKIDKHCVVTYRIKRIDTIIDKIKRYRNNPNGSMKLSRMWDIAGCRCIFNSNDESKLYKLLEIINNEYGGTCKVNDYIKERKESGYRCIHIYVKDHKSNKPIEIQIRNTEQHNWATLVEIIDVLYNTKEKFSIEQDDLGRFLYLYSRRLEGLTQKEYNQLISIEKKRRIFETMSSRITTNNINIRKQWLSIKNNGAYYVIEANRETTVIESYNTFADAENAYFQKYLNDNEFNIVLTHIPNATFEVISMAYSNYLLSMHAFFDDFRKLISYSILFDVQNHNLFQLHKDFNLYKRNSICHWRNLKQEILQLVTANKTNTNKTQLRKWEKNLRTQISLWSDETKKLVRKVAFASNGSVLFRKYLQYRFNKLSKLLSKA